MRAEINFEKIVESVKKELLIQINLALEETIGDAIKNFELKIRDEAVKIGLHSVNMLYDANTNRNSLQINIINR